MGEVLSKALATDVNPGNQSTPSDRVKKSSDNGQVSPNVIKPVDNKAKQELEQKTEPEQKLKQEQESKQEPEQKESEQKESEEKKSSQDIQPTNSPFIDAAKQVYSHNSVEKTKPYNNLHAFVVTYNRLKYVEDLITLYDAKKETGKDTKGINKDEKEPGKIAEKGGGGNDIENIFTAKFKNLSDMHIIALGLYLMIKLSEKEAKVKDPVPIQAQEAKSLSKYTAQYSNTKMHEPEYLDTFQDLSKHMNDFLYFFLLRNLDFIIKKNEFEMDVSLIKGPIETLFNDKEFMEMLLPPTQKKLMKKSRTTEELFPEDFKATLSKSLPGLEDYVDKHIKTKSTDGALKTRVKSFNNRKQFFDNVLKSYKETKARYDKTIAPDEKTITEGEKPPDQDYWEKNIISLIVSAPARYLHIQTCVPYTELYSIRSIDKALLIKYLITYLRSKLPILSKITGTMTNLFSKQSDEKFNAHIMGYYNKSDVSKFRYPILKAQRTAYEYIRICDIIHNHENPFQETFFKTLETTNEFNHKDTNVFPGSGIVINSIVGRILTRSYPYRLDMQSFDYEHMVKNIQTILGKFQEPKDSTQDKALQSSTQDEVLQGSTQDKVLQGSEEVEAHQGSKQDKHMVTKSAEQPSLKSEEQTGEQNGGVNSPSNTHEEQGQSDESQPNLSLQGPIVNQHVVHFIKSQILEKIGNADYFSSIKNALIDIVKVNELTYVLVSPSQEVLDKSNSPNQEVLDKSNIPNQDGPDNKPTETIITTLNEIHDVFNDDNIRNYLIDDELDPYEVYFNEIDRLIYVKAQEEKTTSSVEPQTATTQDQTTEKDQEQSEKEVTITPAAKPDDPSVPVKEPTPESKDPPKADDPAATKPEPTTKPEQPDPSAAKPEEPGKPGQDPQKAVGGGQKKHTFEGRLYNVHEHRGVKYIMTKSYGIVPVYS
jgi:hypothetical protein